MSTRIRTVAPAAIRNAGVATWTTSLRHYPFFWPAISGGPHLSDVEAVEWAGVPVDVELELLVTHPSAVTPPATVMARLDQSARTFLPVSARKRTLPP